MYFAGGALVRLHGDGRAETLIDPPRLGEDCATLHRALSELLGLLPESKESWVVRPPAKGRR